MRPAAHRGRGAADSRWSNGLLLTYALRVAIICGLAFVAYRFSRSLAGRAVSSEPAPQLRPAPPKLVRPAPAVIHDEADTVEPPAAVAAPPVACSACPACEACPAPVALQPPSPASTALHYVSSNALAQPLAFNSTFSRVLLGETMHFGPQRDLNLPSPTLLPAFNVEQSVGYLIHDSRGKHMNDEYVFHSVQMRGDALFVYNFKHDAEGMFPLKGRDAGSDWPVGLRLVESPTPLPCAGSDVASDTTYYYFRPHTAFNQYHAHNDNLLPLYMMVMEMRSGLDSNRRNVVILGPNSASQGTYHALSQPFFAWALTTIFDEVHEVSSPAIAAGVCMTNLRVERSWRIFQPAARPMAAYLAQDVVRRYATHVKVKAGLLPSDLSTAPPYTPSYPPRVGLIQRTRRGFSDDDYVRTAFAEVGVDVRTIKLEDMAPVEQVALMHELDILIGVHGAGLTNAVYMRRGSLLVQLCPTRLSYWDTALFHRMATLAGVAYYDWHEMDEHFVGSGVAKEVSSFHFAGANAETEPRDVRSFVANVLITWMRAAADAVAIASAGATVR